MSINFRSAFIKAAYTVMISIFVYHFFYIEFIRENIEDAAFDLINEYYLSDKKVSLDTPETMLFKVDEYSLKANGLLRDDNETRYGYLYPRNHIAAFIEKVDQFTIANDGICPKALFIDYDFSYPGSYDTRLTPHDEKLLSTLAQERCYRILIPKTQNQNFIENSHNPLIQKAIRDHNILFVSVGLTEAGDRISRRYYPYEYYKNNDGDKQLYTAATITLWNASQRYSPDQIKQLFSQQRISLIENRIIYKDKVIYEQTKQYEALQSYWQNLNIYSANYPFENIVNERFQDAILLYGSAHQASNDHFIIDVFDTEISGIEMHANALMTLLYLDGKLQRLNIYLNSLLIFIIVFGVDIVIQWVSHHWKWLQDKKNAYVLVSLAVMLFVSIFLLNVYKVWFNWLIPSLLTMTVPLMLSAMKLVRNTRMLPMTAYLFTVKITASILNKIQKKGD